MILLDWLEKHYIIILISLMAEGTVDGGCVETKKLNFALFATRLCDKTVPMV